MLFSSISPTPAVCILKPNCTLQARATHLTADNSRRAGELELKRIRREHEENQVSCLTAGKTHKDSLREMARQRGRGAEVRRFSMSTDQQALMYSGSTIEDCEPTGKKQFVF